MLCFCCGLSRLIIDLIYFDYLGNDYCSSLESSYSKFREDGFLFTYFSYFKVLFGEFRIAILLLVFVIAKLKSSNDILQGISKLDYLMKVSIF